MSAEATAWVWRNSPWKGVSHVRFLLHLAVADVVNDAHDNLFWMAQGGLAKKVGCRRATVTDWIAAAVTDGHLEVVEGADQRGGKPNVYRFLFAGQGVRLPDTGCTPSVQGGVRPADTELKEELKSTKEDPIAAVAQRVLDAWVAATGRDSSRVKLNGKRVAAVKARLNEGYSEQDLIDAVTGLTLSAWHMGDNPERKRYDDLLIAIRDGERVERFRDLTAAGEDAGRRAGSATAEAMRRRSRGE